MIRLALGLASLVLTASACRTANPDYGRPLPPGAPALLPLEPGEEAPDFASDWNGREEVLPAIDLSIQWMRREHSRQFFPQAGVEHDRALRSLERFRELLITSNGAADFERALEQEFTVYKSAGWNGRGGGVLFTGYCTPLLSGRVEPDARYRWPLYSLPPDLVKGNHGEILGMETSQGVVPYPSRRAIEAGGLLAERQLELVWLESPVDAFLAHVNGSAFVLDEGGEMLRFGYAGKNGREYRSLGRELIADRVIAPEEMNVAAIRAWAERTPEEDVVEYLHRNRSYVFFTPIGGYPHGSLDFEVTSERTIATDKSLFPRAAVTFVVADLPDATGRPAPFTRFLMDQDTGGAIRTAGRADIYLGIGPEAEARAGRTTSEGQLYYLFLNE